MLLVILGLLLGLSVGFAVSVVWWWLAILDVVEEPSSGQYLTVFLGCAATVQAVIAGANIAAVLS